MWSIAPFMLFGCFNFHTHRKSTYQNDLKYASGLNIFKTGATMRDELLYQVLDSVNLRKLCIIALLSETDNSLERNFLHASL